MTDPKLIKDAAGEYHLQKGSPAVDAAKGIMLSINSDMDGQLRNTPFDIGADEFSTTAVKARILNPADVGHKL